MNSPEARKKMSLAMKARWAKAKASDLSDKALYQRGYQKGYKAALKREPGMSVSVTEQLKTAFDDIAEQIMRLDRDYAEKTEALRQQRAGILDDIARIVPCHTCHTSQASAVVREVRGNGTEVHYDTAQG